MNNPAEIRKLLFICSRNKVRSLTAEKIFAGHPRYQARSAGTQPGARIVATEGHIGWSDIIFCMEKSHANRLREKFPESVQDKPLVCMQQELVDELFAKIAEHVDLS